MKLKNLLLLFPIFSLGMAPDGYLIPVSSVPAGTICHPLIADRVYGDFKLTAFRCAHDTPQTTQLTAKKKFGQYEVHIIASEQAHTFCASVKIMQGQKIISARPYQTQGEAQQVFNVLASHLPKAS